jgi:hypothetical protein
VVGEKQIAEYARDLGVGNDCAHGNRRLATGDAGKWRQHQPCQAKVSRLQISGDKLFALDKVLVSRLPVRTCCSIPYSMTWSSSVNESVSDCGVTVSSMLDF